MLMVEFILCFDGIEGRRFSWKRRLTKPLLSQWSYKIMPPLLWHTRRSSPQLQLVVIEHVSMSVWSTFVFTSLYVDDLWHRGGIKKKLEAINECVLMPAGTHNLCLCLLVRCNLGWRGIHEKGSGAKYNSRRKLKTSLVSWSVMYARWSMEPYVLDLAWSNILNRA